MSSHIRKVLYFGENITLVETLLTSLVDDNSQISYHTTQLLSRSDVLSVMAEEDYHYFITEQPIPKDIRGRIKSLFPLLKTSYLNNSSLTDEKVAVEPCDLLISKTAINTLNCISIPIYYKNTQGKIIACNRSFSHSLGLTCDDVVGKYVDDILPISLQEGTEVIDKKLFGEHHINIFECDLYDDNGNKHEVLFHQELITGTDIQIGLMFDVSELNKARRDLEKDHLMLRATADISPDLIFFKDLESRFLGCNKQFEKFIGQPEDKIVGKKDEDFFALEQAVMCQKQDQGVMFNNETYSGDEYLTYVDGERHFIDMEKVPLLDEKGDVHGLIAIGRDITAQFLLQKRFKVANAVFENSQENIIVTSQTGEIISANRAACKLTGYLKKELLKYNIDILSSHLNGSAQEQLPKNQHKMQGDWKGDITYINKAGEIHFAWLDIYMVELEEGVSNHIYYLTDFKQNINTESKIQYLSKYDPLTSLFNRIALFTKLEDAINRSHFNEIAMAVVLIDINAFKAVNDQYGHNAGDKVLQEVAIRLKQCVFEKDTVARLADDKFIVIVEGLKNEHNASLVAKKVIGQFSRKFKVGDIEATLSANIGISLCPDDGIDVDALLLNAEKAMLRAKQDKDNAYHFYTNQLTEHSSQQRQLEAELKIALQEDQFEIYYQPQYNLNKKLIVGMESLLRWNHPKYGVLVSDRFLSLAEECRLLIPIGLLMFKKVAQQAVLWKKSNTYFGRLAISLSASQLKTISLIADIQSILKESSCSSKDIEVEIMQSTFENDNHIIRENLFNIHKLGIAITVDGFGSDIPIFHFIEPLGIEKFKISRSYSQGVPGHFIGDALIKSVMVFAQELGVDVVGNGFNSASQETFLKNQPLSAGQGNYQAQPMKATETAFYLRCHKKK